MQLPRMSPQGLATQLYPSQKGTLTTKRKGHALADIAPSTTKCSPLQHHSLTISANGCNLKKRVAPLLQSFQRIYLRFLCLGETASSVSPVWKFVNQPYQTNTSWTVFSESAPSRIHINEHI